MKIGQLPGVKVLSRLELLSGRFCLRLCRIFRLLLQLCGNVPAQSYGGDGNSLNTMAGEQTGTDYWGEECGDPCDDIIRILIGCMWLRT